MEDATKLNSVQVVPGSKRKPDDRVEFYRRYMGDRNMNFGCALNQFEGFVNVDTDPSVKPDVVWDGYSLVRPFEENSFDCIYASHVLEHIPGQQLLDTVYEFWRLLKPGGFLISITPYASSFDALECPHHVQYFTENTFMYFDRRTYFHAVNAGFGATENGDYGVWDQEQVMLVPYDEFIGDPAIEQKRRHMLNVIKEVHGVLKAVKEE